MLNVDSHSHFPHDKNNRNISTCNNQYYIQIEKLYHPAPESKFKL